MVAVFLLLAATGALLTLLTLTLASAHLPRRQSYAGHSVPTSAGLTLLPILLVMLGLVVTGVLDPGEGGGAYLAYSLAAGLVGYVDDRWGGSSERGFAGHFGALWEGRVTTGLFKVVVLGGWALVFGVAGFGVGWRALVAAFVLAGCANLTNLLDVRPGRALKFTGVFVLVVLYVAWPGEEVVAIAGVTGGAVALFYFDLKGRIMLGDAGAAIWGAVLGYLVVASGPGLVWWVAGVAIVGLTAVAEFSSISRVVEEVGALRTFDHWGRGGDE